MLGTGLLEAIDPRALGEGEALAFRFDPLEARPASRASPA
jgi:hypothetical protein